MGSESRRLWPGWTRILLASRDCPGWMVLREGRVTSWWEGDRVGRDTVTPGTVGRDTAITLPGDTVFIMEPEDSNKDQFYFH